LKRPEAEKTMGSSTLRSSKSPLMPVAESMSFGYLNGVRYGASPSVDGKAGAAAAEVTRVATLRRKLRRVCMIYLTSYIAGIDKTFDGWCEIVTQQVRESIESRE